MVQTPFESRPSRQLQGSRSFSGFGLFIGYGPGVRRRVPLRGSGFADRAGFEDQVKGRLPDDRRMIGAVDGSTNVLRSPRPCRRTITCNRCSRVGSHALWLARESRPTPPNGIPPRQFHHLLRNGRRWDQRKWFNIAYSTLMVSFPVRYCSSHTLRQSSMYFSRERVSPV